MQLSKLTVSVSFTEWLPMENKKGYSLAHKSIRAIPVQHGEASFAKEDFR